MALVTAVTGLGLVVAHAGLTVGCTRGNAPESQAPPSLDNASTTPVNAGPSNAGAPSKPAGGSSKAKDRMRYMPATKAAPVFLPNDDAFQDDQILPQPAQQNAAPPQQQRPKGGR